MDLVVYPSNVWIFDLAFSSFSLGFPCLFCLPCIFPTIFSTCYLITLVMEHWN